jgi:hypothetical protein
MFTNIFYTGMFQWKGTVYNGNHKPMITMEEYDRVQIILGRKGKPRAQTHQFAYTLFPLSAVSGSFGFVRQKRSSSAPNVPSPVVKPGDCGKMCRQIGLGFDRPIPPGREQ